MTYTLQAINKTVHIFLGAAEASLHFKLNKMFPLRNDIKASKDSLHYSKKNLDNLIMEKK